MSRVSDDISPDQDPYVLASRHEVLRLFRRMMDDNLLIQMKGQRYSISTVTTLLDIDATADRLIVESAPQIEVNQALLDDGRAQFEVLVDQVKVQFIGQPLQAAMLGGRQGLAMPVPPSVRRIQRRGSYRVQVPVSNPAMCTLAFRPNPVTLALHDLSASGLAMRLPGPDVQLDIGTFLHNCTLMLPEVGRIQANLQVVREEERELPNGKRVRHVGASFVDLRGSGQNLLQNYIFGLERQMIARKRGLA